MKAIRRQLGFSLTEVLLAIGTMAIGMLFVAGVFMLGVHETTTAGEKSIASVAAAEAFAKMRAYGAAVDPNDPNTGLYEHTVYALADSDEHYYPSVDTLLTMGQGQPTVSRQSQYSWTALTRPLPSGASDATVFVLRHQADAPLRVSPYDYDALESVAIDGGYVLLDAPVDDTGVGASNPISGILRVRRSPGQDPDIVFDPPLPDPPPADTTFWMVPERGGRNPVVDIYRMTIQLGIRP